MPKQNITPMPASCENGQLACPECGLLHRHMPLAPGKVAHCRQCHTVLYRDDPAMTDSVLALTVAGLILFALSNVFPLLGLRAQGVETGLHLLGASWAFWQQGFWVLALLVSLNLFLFPLLELLSLLTIALTIRLNWQPDLAILLFRWMRVLKPWGMLEVFMLGILVSLVKLGSMATLIVGTAFWSFSALIVVMAAANAVLDPYTVWQKLDKRCRH